jgi:hypothetical protein
MAVSAESEPVCTENLIRVDGVAESPKLQSSGRSPGLFVVCDRIVSLFIAAGINPCAHGRTVAGTRCADTERSDRAR